MAAPTTSTPDKELEIYTPDHLKSNVWRYFGFPKQEGKITSKDKVICKICRTKLVYHTTTSNLRAHLSTLHPGKLEEEEGEVSGTRQARIDSMLSPSRGLPYARQNRATDLLTRFVCEDMRPINVIYGSGFQAFVHELEPRFKIPCYRTMNSKITKLYDTTKGGIREMLHGEKLSLTTDGWSSLATESYVTVTAHFIDEDWEMRNVVLDTSKLQTAHTAENVSTCIDSILRDYHIEQESVLVITTDNAMNYVNAVEQHLGITDIPCMAHTINLAARKGLAQRSVATAVSRLKAAAQHFKHSPTDSYLLEAKQKLLGLKPVQLINDCPTRWNSTYEMICRAADQQAPVAAVIMEKKITRLELSSVEWTLMEKVKDVLKPLKVATQALSTENYPTASAVLPLQYVLLTQLKPSTDDPAGVKEMKTMSTDLKARYGPDKDALLLLNTASYLDPRFHRLVHLEQESRQAVRDKVQRELAEVSEETGEEEGPGQDENATTREQRKEKNTLSAMGDLFGDVYCQNWEEQPAVLVERERPQVPPSS
ncbi:E3 SUMO-protein ligase ZBED1-like [Alosa alosa]|uniref:E3 SUMO-protein ligase ZBED1-like n=1 Tax=Alosa alosa TaxID=278164 RepID=UPI002015416C|nr:E3 SUMO-protein ligase ZBED1-like [Alosa alosa]